MAKKKLENENVYFPHFISARNDRKIKRLRKELNVEGYGIFFMLLEVLREQSDLKYPIDDLDLLADEFGTSEQKIRVVICNYGLFEVIDERFFSPKQIEYLQPYFEKSKRAKHAALIRWNNEEIDANAYANALPEHSVSNAVAMQGKERKVKESKVEESKDVYVDEIESSRRDDEIMKQLSTSVIPDDKKEIYLKRLKANSYLKNIKGDKYKIKLDSIRAEAEYLYSMGYLNPTKPKSEENPQYKTIGGYWNE
jgi:hypothetical protein